MEEQPSLQDCLAALTNPDPVVRQKALDGIADLALESSAAVSALVGAMQDPDERVREAAVWKITEHIAPLVALNDALGAEDPKISEAAAIALGEIGPAAKPTLHALRAKIKDELEYRYVRRAAADAVWGIAGAGGRSSSVARLATASTALFGPGPLADPVTIGTGS
jgi:hypothetical protein